MVTASRLGLFVSVLVVVEESASQVVAGGWSGSQRRSQVSARSCGFTKVGAAVGGGSAGHPQRVRTHPGRARAAGPSLSWPTCVGPAADMDHAEEEM
jgi:hypothetical protein